MTLTSKFRCSNGPPKKANLLIRRQTTYHFKKVEKSIRSNEVCQVFITTGEAVDFSSSSALQFQHSVKSSHLTELFDIVFSSDSGAIKLATKQASGERRP